MDEQNLTKELLEAVDEFITYRTDGKLQDLVRARNKLRKEREHVRKTCQCHEDAPIFAK